VLLYNQWLRFVRDHGIFDFTFIKCSNFSNPELPKHFTAKFLINIPYLMVRNCVSPLRMNLAQWKWEIQGLISLNISVLLHPDLNSLDSLFVPWNNLLDTYSNISISAHLVIDFPPLLTFLWTTLHSLQLSFNHFYLLWLKSHYPSWYFEWKFSHALLVDVNPFLAYIQVVTPCFPRLVINHKIGLPW